MAKKAEIKRALVEKLRPDKLRVSPKFSAMLACLLGQKGWTTPAYAALLVTGDGFLLGMHEGDCGYNDFIGDADDLVRNVNGVLDAVGATDDERAYLLARVEACRGF